VPAIDRNESQFEPNLASFQMRLRNHSSPAILLFLLYITRRLNLDREFIARERSSSAINRRDLSPSFATIVFVTSNLIKAFERLHLFIHLFIYSSFVD
jgi:hypothetical protein